MKSLWKKKHGELVDLPSRKNLVGFQCIYIIKYKSNGTKMNV
jgi:hypothetical protein